MTTLTPRRVLVVYWHLGPQEIRAAIRHHLHALEYAGAKHRVWYANLAGGTPRWLRHLAFDGVILHTTFLCLRWSHLFHLSKWKIRWLRELDCPKIAMPQDEYDHAEILDEWLAELGVSAIFTTFDEPVRRSLYPIMSERARFYRCLTGYIDETSAARCRTRLLATGVRPKDVVYRATHLPYWFGSHGQLKHRVGEVVAARARERFGLTCDVSTQWEDTIVGDAWFDFLMSGRVVIGTESGSSALDRRGEVRARIQKLLRDDPQASFEDVSRQMPAGWDGYRFFAMSPRHFEAIITKTCQVLVAGEYDGVLVPHRHYIPLKRDFSDLDEVLEKVSDRDLVRTVAEQAYEDIYLSGRYNYRQLARDLEAALLEGDRPQRSRGRLWGNLSWSAAEAVVRMQTAAATPGSSLLRLMHPFWGLVGSPRGSLAPGLKTARMIVSCRWLRELLFAAVRSSHPWRTIRLDRVLADLLRLGIVWEALTARLTAGSPFRVSVEWQAEALRLTLRSYQSGSDAQGGAALLPKMDWAGLADALQAGRVREMIWDHTRVSSSVTCALTRSTQLTVRLGEAGVYRFSALIALLHLSPRRVAKPLLALMQAVPRQSSRAHRLVARARRGVGLGARLGWGVLRARDLRRVVLAYVRDSGARRTASPKSLASDILRLQLVRSAVTESDGEPGFHASVEYHGGDRLLTYRSSMTGWQGPGDVESARELRDAMRPLTSIRWDHSAVAPNVPCRIPGGTALLGLGEHGVYAFEALEVLAQRHQAAVWGALVPAAASSVWVRATSGPLPAGPEGYPDGTERPGMPQ